MPLVAAVVVGFVYVIWRLRGRKTRNPNLPPRWGLLYAYACLAGLSHILLDFTNSYGVRPFWPFSERWNSWDIVFIVEPVLLVVLTLGLIVPALFSLINEEIGARSKGDHQEDWPRLLALLGRLRLLGTPRLRASPRHSRAPSAQVSGSRRHPRFRLPIRSIRSAGMESSKHPLLRHHGCRLLNSIRCPEVDPEGRMQIRYKPEETPVTLAAKKTYLGRVYSELGAVSDH